MSAKKIFMIVAGAGFLALLMFAGAGCGSSTTPGPGDNTRMFTSTTANAHTHTVVIAKADIQTPPSAGISETTSANVGHSHTFGLTEAQLVTINGGTAVTQATGTSDVGGTHFHEFTISKWF